MTQAPLFQEDHISQVPALQFLINLGYNYIAPEDALDLRNSKTSNVILEKILEKQLRKMNQFTYKGETYSFSNSNITNAINALKNIPYDGVVKTNETIYDLLSLGKSLEETVQGNTRSYTLNYIDWEHIENNVFHVTEEYDVEISDGTSHRRPDIVLFVNGIPFIVIECKSPDIDHPIKQAISQQIRNQKDENIPKLFIYAQILMVISKNKAKYGTVSTPMKLWSVWKEKNNEELEIENIINTPIPTEQKDNLFLTRFKYVRDYFDGIETSGRLVTEQDRALYSLLRKERLMELCRQFIVFDKSVKKIARYQQYYAVKNSLERVKIYEKSKKRKGGVIWHTQGSGKSLTMVMLAKALALDNEIENPRIVLVTDRINLDRQIYNTFRHCGMEPVKASSGRNLLNLLEKNKRSIITTVIDKFESAVTIKEIAIDSENIFVLVDESHRSQYGSANALMQTILPNGCYIGFTGTPLMKKDKMTTEKFGGFIDKYTIDQAVKDKAVVPLLYEGKHIPQEVNKDAIDSWFDRISAPLTEAQKADLKHKFSRIDKLNASEQKIYLIAYDISEHFNRNWKNTGFKAQFATSSKAAAIKYHEFFKQIGLVSTEVIISPPDTREGHEDIHDEPTDEVVTFWKTMMDKYRDERQYNEQIIDAFNNDEKPEILIVVDKLLTGFDSPKNTVLYLAKQLREHNLLQAIARVNRITEGKDYGYIIDYLGILGELDKALTTYQALDEFDEEDLIGTLSNVNEEIKSLPQKHSALWDVFKDIRNKQDEEEYEQLLFDEELRQLFYEKLSQYSRTLGIALSSPQFFIDNSKDKIKKYKDDLKFFQKLRVSVRKRYAETIDISEYEPKIMKLLDTYVTSTDVLTITKPIDIFNKEEFEKELANIVGVGSRADTIAHRTKKAIRDKIEDDPVYYEKFSKLLNQTISDYHLKRITEAEYFKMVQDIMNNIIERKDEGEPEILKDKDVAKAFYGVTLEIITVPNLDEIPVSTKNLAATISIMIDEIIRENRVVDWHLKTDVQNKMRNQIEDYLKDKVKPELDFDTIDKIMEKILQIAKKRYAS